MEVQPIVAALVTSKARKSPSKGKSSTWLCFDRPLLTPVATGYLVMIRSTPIRGSQENVLISILMQDVDLSKGSFANPCLFFGLVFELLYAD